MLKPDATRPKPRIESKIRRNAVCNRLGLFGSTVEGTAKSDCNWLSLGPVSAREPALVSGGCSMEDARINRRDNRLLWNGPGSLKYDA